MYIFAAINSLCKSNWILDLLLDSKVPNNFQYLCQTFLLACLASMIALMEILVSYPLANEVKETTSNSRVSTPFWGDSETQMFLSLFKLFLQSFEICCILWLRDGRRGLCCSWLTSEASLNFPIYLKTKSYHTVKFEIFRCFQGIKNFQLSGLVAITPWHSWIAFWNYVAHIHRWITDLEIVRFYPQEMIQLLLEIQTQDLISFFV